MSKREIVNFIESQKSLHLYKNIQEACIEVLSNLPGEQFERIKDNLIIMAFHDGMSGQVMHFPARRKGFAVMQLYIQKSMPSDVLKWVIAHELGHVMQKRNWKESDGMKLEDDATKFAQEIGYPKTEIINRWLATNS